jgi:hypothetical protein
MNTQDFLLAINSLSKDINSKEINEKQNEQYKVKFETEILKRLDVKWKRQSCR